MPQECLNHESQRCEMSDKIPCKHVRCEKCGRFLSIFDETVKVDFTPDTHFTCERTEWYCSQCYDTIKEIK